MVSLWFGLVWLGFGSNECLWVAGGYKLSYVYVCMYAMKENSNRRFVYFVASTFFRYEIVGEQNVL